MLRFINNKNNLKENDITEIVVKVKALLINSNNEILLRLSHNNYQFPGGHIEENENLIDALNREVEEETGIKLKLTNEKYFAISISYFKNHLNKGINRKIIVYYFMIHTDLKPDLNKIKYNEGKIEDQFILKYIPINDAEKLLNDNAKKYGDKFNIAKDMIELIKYAKGRDLCLKKS